MKKKIIACITGLAIVAIIAPSSAQAVTAAELQAQIDALMATLADLQVQLADLTGEPTGGTVTGCTITSFTRNLKVGMSGDDVKCLQIVLNTASDTQLSAGVGSPGQETSYFGPKTKAAVIKFQEKYASAILASWGLTSGTGYVGSTTLAKLNSLLAAGEQEEEEEEEEPTGALGVSLASDTPVSGSIVGGAAPQGLASLAKFTFTNNGDGTIKVTQLKVKRIGISADAGLLNVYLFDGAIRLTDSASVSSGIITFTETTGIFTVPSGGSKTLTVRTDLSTTSSAGETYGVAINAAADVISNAASVGGSFPVNGNLMTVATATLAGVDFTSAAVASPTTNSGLAPQDNYTVWQKTVSITTRAVDFTRISFRMIGSVKYADIQNFRLYVGGVQVGSAIASLDDNGYVTFDLSASPKRIEAGSRIIKLVADIIGGSSLNFKFSVRSAADANFTDTQYNINVFPITATTASTFTVAWVTSGVQTVSSGTLTITKMTDSPSGNIVNTAPAVTLAKYELKAAGEKVKIETLTLAWIFTDSDSTTDATDDASSLQTMRNTMLLANDVQVGSTKSMATNTAGGTEFPLGSSLVVEPGSPVTLKVVGDIFDNHGAANEITADDIIQIRIIAGSSNALGMVSSESVSVPASYKNSNQVTVKAGALTFAKYAAYTNQTAVAPLNDYKLAHFTLRSDTTEAINISTIAVDLNQVSGAASDLWVKYGANETSHIATISQYNNSFSVNYELAAGTTVDVEVYCDVASTVDSSNGIASVLISGTTADSATSVTGPSGGTALAGQTINFSTGSIASAKGAGMPLDQLVAGSQQITAGKYKFTAVNDDYTIRKIKAYVDATDSITEAVSSLIINYAILKDGTTVIATQPFDTTVTAANDGVYFTGLSIPIPANTSKTLTIDLDLGAPVADVSTSQINTLVTLHSFEHADSQGTIDTDTSTRAGNKIYVLKSVPTVTKVAVTKSTLGTGTVVDLYKWKIGATGGDMAVRTMKFGLTWADTDQSAMELEYIKLYKGVTDISSLVYIEDQGGTSAKAGTGVTSLDNTIVVTWINETEDTIEAGSQTTYTLRATAQGFASATNITADDKVSIYLKDDTAVNGNGAQTIKYISDTGTGNQTQLCDPLDANAEDANFIWSDMSAISHNAVESASSSDWLNGYLVLNLPLDSEQWIGP